MPLTETLRYVLVADSSGMARDLKKAEAGLKGVSGTAEAARISSARMAADMSKRFNDVGEKLSAIGKKATMYVTLPILAVGAASVKAASDLYEAQNVTDQVFGGMAESVTKFSKAALESFGMSRKTALDAANQFGLLLRAADVTGEPLVKMSTTLAALAGDAASFKNVRLEDAVLAIRAGLAGESEPLRKFGVFLSEASTQAKIFKMGLATTSKEITYSMKVQARYAQITEGLKVMQGDFIRTQDSVANRFRSVGEAVQNTGAVLGENLLPVVQKASGWVIDLANRFGRMSEETQKWVVIAGAAFAAGGPLIAGVGQFQKAIGGVLGLWARTQVGATMNAQAVTLWGTAMGAAKGKLVGWGKAIQNAMSTTDGLVTKLSGLKLAAAGVAAAGITIVTWWALDTLKKQAEQAAKAVEDIKGNPQTINEQGEALGRMQVHISELLKLKAEMPRDWLGNPIDMGAWKQADKTERELTKSSNELFDAWEKGRENTAMLAKEFGLTDEGAESLALTMGVDLTKSSDEVYSSFSKAMYAQTGFSSEAAETAGITKSMALEMAEANKQAEVMSQRFKALAAPTIDAAQAEIEFQEQLDALKKIQEEFKNGTIDTTEEVREAGKGALGAAEFWGKYETALIKAKAPADYIVQQKEIFMAAIAGPAGVAKGEAVPAFDAATRALKAYDEQPADATLTATDNASPTIKSINDALDQLFHKVGLPDAGIVLRAAQGDVAARKFLFNERGGILPTYVSGTGGGRVDAPTVVVGEGGGPEYVIPTEPKYRTRAFGLMTDLSKELGITGLAAGGMVGAVVNDATRQSGEKAVKAAKWIDQLVRRVTGKGRQAAEFARAQVGKPYVWAASGPNAYDCSGLTMASWAHAGVGIPRVSHDQINAARGLPYGEAVSSPGALFYTQSAGSPSGGHIAISHGDGSLTNARGVATGVTITGPFPGRQGMPVFDGGGTLAPGVNVVRNNTGAAERLVPESSSKTVTNNFYGYTAEEVIAQGRWDAYRERIS